MKSTLHTAIILAGLSMTLLSSCTRLETAPEGQRAATPPRGSSDIEKSWNAPTQQEQEAMLGPLGQLRR